MRTDLKRKYSFSNYVYLSRWVSYWHQIEAVLRSAPEKVLVIGIGDNLVIHVLGQYCATVDTLDIEIDLQPKVSGSVLNLPYKSDVYDVILCAQVLEHLPFKYFDSSLKELHRVTRKTVVLSLPHFSPQLRFSVKIPFLPEIKAAYKAPFPLKHKLNGEHYWEIGKRHYPPRKIRSYLNKYFSVQREFVPFENQYHRFYLLKK
jgi:hypothetical protein